MKKFLLLLVVLFSFGSMEISARRYYIDLTISLELKKNLPAYYAMTDLGLNTKGSSWGYLYDNELYGSYFFSPQSIVNYLSAKGWTFYELTETNIPSAASGIIDAIAGQGVSKNLKWEHYILYKDCDSDNDILHDIKLTEKLVKPQKTEKEKVIEQKHEKIREQGDGVYQ